MHVKRAKTKAISKRQTRSVEKMNFTALVQAIQGIHNQFAGYAARAVNVSLTVRNWLVGCYIQEYEQRGTDRAKYGTNLFERLSHELGNHNGVVYHPRELRRCRQFYQAYPQIRGALSPELTQEGTGVLIQGAATPEFDGLLDVETREAAVPGLIVDGKRLVQNLSFSHFAELLEISDALKRTFYELECIKGHWSVRELKRQIASLYYERCGLSKDKKALSRLTQAKAEAATPKLTVRDPYVFEFLGLKPKEVMSESHLEEALLDKVQEFLLELGRGFCFEARQKRILIGGEYFFVDMVFYHRILRCHVLIELKLGVFNHEHLGQLNSYVGWYKEHEMMAGDNPPVGILLCTEKNHALVKYALAGMNNQLFVSKYQLKLPSVDELRAFVEGELKK